MDPFCVGLYTNGPVLCGFPLPFASHIPLLLGSSVVSRRKMNFQWRLALARDGIFKICLSLALVIEFEVMTSIMPPATKAKTSAMMTTTTRSSSIPKTLES